MICLHPLCRVRTSSGTFLARGRDKIIRNIEKKIANFTFLPVGKLLIFCPLYLLFITIYDCHLLFVSMMFHKIQNLFFNPKPQYTEHGEGLQILHYEVGQKYEPHYDYFQDEYNTKNGGQRIATVLMYL